MHWHSTALLAWLSVCSIDWPATVSSIAYTVDWLCSCNPSFEAQTARILRISLISCLACKKNTAKSGPPRDANLGRFQVPAPKKKEEKNEKGRDCKPEALTARASFEKVDLDRATAGRTNRERQLGQLFSVVATFVETSQQPAS